MKKYVYYIAIAAILLTIVLVLVFNDRPGTITGSDKNFAISDTTEITKIKYVYNGSVLELTRNNNVWVLNKKYAAKPQFISLTFKILQQINVISSVPKESLQKALEALNEKSMQVTIEAGDKMVVQYRFCEVDTAPSKAYMIMEGSSKPFIVNITGYDIPVLTLFSTSESMWRDKKVFVTSPSDILMVGVAYPQKPDQSFSLNFINDSIFIKYQDVTEKMVSRENVQNYLTSLTKLNADKFSTSMDPFKYADIRNNIPYAEFVIKNKDNKLETLKIYQIADKTKPNGFNPDMLIGLEGADTIPVLFKYTDFDPLLKVKSDFVGK